MYSWAKEYPSPKTQEAQIMSSREIALIVLACVFAQDSHDAQSINLAEHTGDDAASADVSSALSAQRE
jgi:hypothetical protein